MLDTSGVQDRITFRLVDNYNKETILLLRQKYPGKTDSEIVRELLFQWRLRHDEENTKERKLDMILRLCFEMLRAVEGEGLSAEFEDFLRWWHTERATE